MWELPTLYLSLLLSLRLIVMSKVCKRHKHLPSHLHLAELCKLCHPLGEHISLCFYNLQSCHSYRNRMYLSCLHTFDIWIFQLFSQPTFSWILISTVLPYFLLSCFTSNAGEFGFGLINAEFRACNFTRPLDLYFGCNCWAITLHAHFTQPCCQW